MTSDENGVYAGNTPAAGIANPDNILFRDGYDVLTIGEDSTDGHQNDGLWALDLTTRELTRIMTTPYGAEVTSADWYGDVGGWAYLRGVVQHPYGESDDDMLVDPADADAYVGYFGPLAAGP